MKLLPCLIENLQDVWRREAIRRLRMKIFSMHCLKSVTENRLNFLILPVMIFLGAFSLMSTRLAGPPYAYFDEGFYVSAGRQLIHNGVNVNWSHPPLGKYLIGVGIKVFGDTPVGWRLPGVFFGSLVIVVMYIWGLILFKNNRDALVVALLTLLNQLIFVQARVATVEIFMIGFLTIALAFILPVCIAWEKTESRHPLLFGCAGFFLALAAAAKWTALLPIGFIWIMSSIASLNSESGGRRRAFLRSTLPFSMGVVLPYFLVFGYLLWGMQHPYFAPRLPNQSNSGYGWLEIFILQPKMFLAQMGFKNPVHGFQSDWFTWPLMWRPVWLESKTWDIDGIIWRQLVVIIGNPLVIWGGGLAMFICIVFAGRALLEWYRYRESLSHDQRTAIAVVFWYLVFWLSWGFIPRKTTFFYYYIPAALWLGPALVIAARILRIPSWAKRTFLLLAVLTSIFYYPIVSFWELPEAEVSRRLFMSNWWTN